MSNEFLFNWNCARSDRLFQDFAFDWAKILASQQTTLFPTVGNSGASCHKQHLRSLLQPSPSPNLATNCFMWLYQCFSVYCSLQWCLFGIIFITCIFFLYVFLFFFVCFKSLQHSERGGWAGESGWLELAKKPWSRAQALIRATKSTKSPDSGLAGVSSICESVTIVCSSWVGTTSSVVNEECKPESP